MEYDYADQLDLKWQSLLQKHLTAFSGQDKSKLDAVDDVLEKVFCPETGFEQEVNYRDKEICEKCLIEALNYLLIQPVPPRQTQICLLLNIAKYTSKDETCFINLNANNIFSNLIYIAQPLNISTDKKTKILFLELLASFLEHQSGIKEIVESKIWWVQAYNLIIYYCNMDKDILNIGYKFLTKLLEQTISSHEEFCNKMIQQMVEPLLEAARLIQTKTQSTKMDYLLSIEKLKPHILCLVEILERLLEGYSAGVLNFIVQLKVDQASDAVSKITNDKSVCLILDRISLILSFFKLTDIFDGIKSISEDPLAITGFLRIVHTEIDKGGLALVIELYYYALKYVKYISERLPKCVLKGKDVDIDTEIICLQLEPVMLIGEKLDYQEYLKSVETDLVRRSHLSKVLKVTLNTLKLGLKVKEVLPAYPFEVFTSAVREIIRSRHLYSKKQLGIVFEGLIFSIQDAVNYVKMKSNPVIDIGLQGFCLELLQAILLFIESYNLSWCDSVKILELAQILVNRQCAGFEWSAPVVVQALKVLQEVISRRLSPAMSLLMDCDEDLNELGPLLYQKCFRTEWEVRNAVLEVVQTIAISANKSFPSFRQILVNAFLPHIASAMALHDESEVVRATAFKCLHEMILMEDMDEILPKNSLITKVLDILVSNADSAVKQGVIKLTRIAYLHRDGLENKVLLKVHKYLEHVALTNPDGNVQMEAVIFWHKVTKKYLSVQGWMDMDKKFPAVTFSKRIVSLTNKEIRKRIYNVLQELSATGCLNIFQKLYQFDNFQPDVKAFLHKTITYFNAMFREYEVTPESMLFNQEFENFPSLSSNIFLSPLSAMESADSDQIIQELSNDMVMKVMPDNIEFIQDEDLYSILDLKYSDGHVQEAPVQPTTQTNHQVTPSEFVDYVYKRVAYLANGADGSDGNQEDCIHKTDDLYNIIDY